MWLALTQKRRRRGQSARCEMAGVVSPPVRPAGTRRGVPRLRSDRLHVRKHFAGELRDALASSPGIATLDGLKRRTRVLTGRCQGFNCCVPTAELISQHFGIPLWAVTKRGPGSEFITRGDDASATPRQSGAPRSHATKSHYRVAIIGAGPAGVGTALSLAKLGVAPVLLVDRAAEIGGLPAKYEAKPGGVPTFVVWTRGRVLFGRQFVDALRRRLERTSVDVLLECQVLAVDARAKSLTLVSPGTGKAEIQADAVVFACGAREKTISERGWLAGSRPARQFFTMHLLQLLDGCHVLPLARPAIIGSDVIAHSAAAKLRTAGSGEVVMIDRRSRPAARWWEQLYFRRWRLPAWRTAAADPVTITGNQCVTGVDIGPRHLDCDGIVLSGELLPNSELLVAAGFAVQTPDRTAVRMRRHELPAPGCFIAGAQVGGFHGAHWCYRDGVRAAADVNRFLRRSTGKPAR